MGPELVYVSGRKRPLGEMNGKSGNLNNVATQLYPEGCTIPSNELLCVFDADQVRPMHPPTCCSAQRGVGPPLLVSRCTAQPSWVGHAAA